ncbi:hypothetical protein GCM10011608_10890 [Micromonospora sonchi]|uniref:Uncharacterized protein n=1 Tax=Micromonospora sonchi TaxID=1763543 RepID=A0A917TMS4_9ACTN|nr:hypothetical protein [Micromonospora sonchi]GGM27882.1 hypothetical protein GCM10011608_10890 [Micromonospora sonchi]
MTDSPVERLIEVSSLGDPDVRALRSTVSDETARRIVARAAQLADAGAVPCTPYYCPTSRSVECCPDHSGWDVCCAKPHRHRPLPREGEPRRISGIKTRLLRVTCRVGLHFLTWNHQYDGYRCGCGRNFLWAEHIR